MENRVLKMYNKNKEFLEKYISVFENLKEDNLDGLMELSSLDIYFEDPFQRTKGKSEYIKIFKDMFLKLDRPTFKVLDYSISEKSKNICFMKWVLTGSLKNNNKKIHTYFPALVSRASCSSATFFSSSSIGVM